ncbi:MAG: hypothetical protein MK180_10100 [Rhodobacteraceae bacterium]|nr:hypothetical protein [Paracoccaceae bacterium]
MTDSTSALQVGAFFGDMNAFTSPAFTVTVSVFSGTDFSGALLGSESFILEDGFLGFQSTDFSSLGTLSAGNYAVGFSSDGNRGRLGTGLSALASTQSLDANRAFSPGFFSDARDFAVLITGEIVDTPAPIPVPASFPLLAAGLFGLIA